MSTPLRSALSRFFPSIIKPTPVPKTLVCGPTRHLKLGEAKWLIIEASKIPDTYNVLQEVGVIEGLWRSGEVPTAAAFQQIQHWAVLNEIIHHLGIAVPDSEPDVVNDKPNDKGGKRGKKVRKCHLQ